MRSKIKCSKVLMGMYSLLIGIYFLGIFPFQVGELRTLQAQANKQNIQYEKFMSRHMYYKETLAYSQLLSLQIRSYEKEFLNYETHYEGTERLSAFLSSYPLQEVKITKEDTLFKEYTGVRLKEEIYHLTYKSSFYQSYEVIQELLNITGASNLKSIKMTDLDKQVITTDLSFVLRLMGDIEDIDDEDEQVQGL